MKYLIQMFCSFIKHLNVLEVLQSYLLFYITKTHDEWYKMEEKSRPESNLNVKPLFDPRKVEFDYAFARSAATELRQYCLGTAIGLRAANQHQCQVEKWNHLKKDGDRTRNGADNMAAGVRDCTNIFSIQNPLLLSLDENIHEKGKF